MTKSGALQDIIGSIKHWQFWLLLGWKDITFRYRRSIIGPWWLTLSSAIFVSAIGLVYGGLFKIALAEYIPFVASGFIVWSIIGQSLTEACNVFVQWQHFLKHTKTYYFVFVLRCLINILIVFLHSLVVFFIAIILFPIKPTLNILYMPFGMMLLIINLTWIMLFLAMSSVRYRDITPFVGSITQIMFIVTPIIWKVDQLPDRAAFLLLNPFYHLIEVVRAPMLGLMPSTTTWTAVVGMAIIGWSLTLLAFNKYKNRIVYWL